MTSRNYSNVAEETTLASGITSGATTLSVASATGWPVAPFILVVEPGTANEELILVGSKSGTTFSSLTRGFGGTSAVAHNAGSDIQHVSVAEDYSLIWSHVHSGAGGDDTSPVAHTDLTTVGANDHHARGHAHNGADGSGTVAHSDITDQAPDDHHTTLSAFEVTGWAPDASVNLTSTLDVHHSLDLTIPGDWGSWEIIVWATWRGHKFSGTTDTSYRVQLTIDGIDETAVSGLLKEAPNQAIQTDSIMGFHSGSTTGVKTIEFKAIEFDGDVSLNNIRLYARAVRTS